MTALPQNKHQERIQQWVASNAAVRSHGIQMRGPELELAILDTIGFDYWSGEGITSKWVKKQLDANKSARTIKILLNSPGGDYFEGVAIHNLLKQSEAKIVVEIIGMAASAASLVAMAGDDIQIHDGAMLMVHEAWSCMCGNAADFESSAALLRQVNASAVDIYEGRTGLARADIEAMVAATTWIKADEAVASGWATKRIPARAPEPAANPEQKKPKQSAAPNRKPQSGSLGAAFL